MPAARDRHTQVPYHPDYQGIFKNPVETWKDFDCVLVNTMEQYKEFIRIWQNCPQRQYIGFDLETTSLNPESVTLVGCSVAFEKTRGFYFPFGHRFGINLPTTVFPHLIQVVKSFQTIYYWNAKFDMRMTRTFGFDLSQIPVVDVMSVIWNWDTNLFMPSLKDSERRILGWEREKYEQLTSRNAARNLSYMAPVEARTYATLDSISLLHLMDKAEPFLTKHQRPISIDNHLLVAMLDIEERPHPLDKARIDTLLENIQTRVTNTERTTTLYLGKIDLESPDQIGKALIGIGVDSGKRTPTGKVQWRAEDLEVMHGKHPAVDAVLEYRQARTVEKVLKGLQASYRSDLGGCRFSYLLYRAPTGRLACKDEERIPYYGKINIQSVIKPAPRFYSVEPTSIPREGSIVLENRFVPLNKQDKKFFYSTGEAVPEGIEIVEGKAEQDNLRRIFIPHPGHYFVHFDYHAQEMRIPANLSRDPAFCEAFIKGEDPHRNTAVMMWGESAYDRDKRGKAKILNFSVQYGISPWSLAEKLGGGITPEEAKSYISRWWSLYPTLNQWARSLEVQGRNQGCVHTFFGRKRSVRYYFELAESFKKESDAIALEASRLAPSSQKQKLIAQAEALRKRSWSMKGFAHRTCVNTVVQGTGGDLIRIALYNLNHDLMPKYGMENVQILSTIHDEINLSVHPSCLIEVIKDTLEIMQRRPAKWPVPMGVGLELGWSWGELYPYHLVEDTLVPGE